MSDWDTPQIWKLRHIIKGTATWTPLLDLWRRRHARTGGTDNPRYCYAVWLRHLVTLSQHGFQIKGARVGELGPGDSIGTGLAALLSGAQCYIGLDAVPFSARCDLESMFNELVQLYSKKEPIPDDREFPRVRPKLASYRFPNHLIDCTDFRGRIDRIRSAIRRGLSSGEVLTYRAPWMSVNEVKPHSLDLIFSQSVLECVTPLEQAYMAMSTWLKPGGHSSNAIDFSATYLSPYWNGHWAYTDWEWRLAQGRREFFLNREPLSTHLNYAKLFGFDIVEVGKERNTSGLSTDKLAPRFRTMDIEDQQTRGAMIILRKKPDEW